MELNKTNIRFRLTWWYSLTLLIILVLYAGITIVLTFVNLRQNLDKQLEKDYEVIEEMVETGPGDTVHIDEDDISFLEERWVEIWDTTGRLLYNSRPFSGHDLPEWSPLGADISALTFASLLTKNHVHLRSLTARANIEGRVFIFRLFRPETPMYAELKKFILLLLIALPLALITATLGGYWLAGRLLAPVGRMTEKARRISSHNLHERLPVDNPSDELGQLALTFNDLLDRIEDSFNRLKQFTFDAAHELRTPLTAIRSTGEVALQNTQDKKKYREIIGSILEENNRLTHLVNSLLFLSRADSGTYQPGREEVDLTQLIAQTIELIQPLAEEKDQHIRFEEKSPVNIQADKTLFRQALLNLLDNAIKYAPAGSEIAVALSARDHDLLVKVTDSGTPIPEEKKEKIFERFFRLDKSRSKELGGSGLGLSIARWAVEMQGGTLTVEPGREQGNTFIIFFKDIISKT